LGNRLVPRYLREAITRKNSSLFSQPAITDLKMEEGKPLQFKAAFEVMPEIRSRRYGDLKPEQKDSPSPDKEVQENSTIFASSRRAFDPVEDRAIADGDFAQVSFVARPKAKASR